MNGTVSDADVERFKTEISRLGLAARVYLVEEEFCELISVRVGATYFNVYPCNDGWWGCHAVGWTRPTRYGTTPGEAFRALWSAEKEVT